MYQTLRPPLIQYDDGLKPLLLKVKWLDWETPEPDVSWTRPEFDDSSWARLPLLRSAAAPYLSRLCIRGKFEVTDPAKVRGLRLSLDYHGGAMVSLNGTEIVRGSIRAGQADLAEAYPQEAFAGDGKPADLAALRVRKLTGVPIPADVLRKGVNVLAIEIVRAPYHAVVMTLGRDKDLPCDLSWYTCQIRQAQLLADSAEGLVPNVVRPVGLQVWNSDSLAGDFDLDFGDPCEPLRPIHLVGPRNGSYSGKVVVGSTRPIEQLKVAASDLRGDSGTIPALAVRIRYGIPWGQESMAGGIYPAPANLFGAMADAPPGTIAVRTKTVDQNSSKLPSQSPPVFGAVVPVWATVKVPPEARPGLYRGEITIEATGENPVKTPIEVQVVDWTLPNPQEYHTWIEFIESPDTLALEYNLEPWSQGHWRMIAKAFSEVSETGSRVVYVPVIAHTNLGNEQSMVRWIRKTDGRFDFDFSIMDQYLDVAVKNLGKPKIVCFVVWDITLVTKEIDREPETRKAVEARKNLIGKGPLVTVLDPLTKRLENTHLPPFTDASSMAIWKPLFDQIRGRMKARGLESAATMGFPSDAVPTKEDTQFLKDASGDMPWVTHSHHGVGQVQGIGKVAYFTHVWHTDFPDVTSLFGWKGDRLHAQYQRGDQNDASAARWRWCAEANIAGGQRGIGRLGADYWYVIKDKTGRRVGTVAARYPESAWRNLDLLSHFLAPAPDGPVATNRLVAVQEGLQECEARICIERALTDKALRETLGDELASRAKETLDERLLYMWKEFSNLSLSGHGYQRATFTPWRGIGSAGHAWFLNTAWQQRSEKLYLLAGEVEKKLKSR